MVPDFNNAAADGVQQADQAAPFPALDDSGFDLAHLVHEARVILREPRDLGLNAALGEAPAQPLDQPCAERIEPATPARHR